jgi:hypothetical protein
MTHPTASNVIPMRDFDRSAGSQQQGVQFEQLLKECQELAMGRLSSSLAAMLEKLSDTLWTLAESAPDRETRDMYFTAREQATAERVEAQFRSRYIAEFDTRANRSTKPHQDFSQYDLSSLELGLVADDELEETLKINDMAAKLRRYCDEELVALDQRVGVLVGDATLQGEGNPFSPQAICNAFKQACRHVEPHLKVRMVFHKLFDDHVLDDIRSIYKDLNALLVQRSILPKIRYGMARRAPGGIGPRPPSPAPGVTGTEAASPPPGPGMPLPPGMIAMPASADYGYGDSAAPASEQDFFAVLQSLMARGFGSAAAGLAAGGPPGAGAAVAEHGMAEAVQIPGFPPILGGGSPAGGLATQPGAARLLQGADLLGSLTRIQHGDVSAVAGGNLPLAATLVEPGTTNVLRELKGTSLGTGMGQMDGMTLDIVAMLFDQIFDDRKIPSAMKGLIGRLQIPMLKVAILDKTFFSKKSHPARQLLDELGEIALGLPADFGHSSALYKRLEEVVQKLIDGFQDGMDIFDELRGELGRTVAEDNRRADEEARESARLIEQKEKLEVARALAQQEIERRAREHKVPQVVLRFLAEQWVKLLIVAHAKYGDSSDAWKTAVSTMDMLVWSVSAKQSTEERRKLAGQLPGLLKRLNAGMLAISADEPTRKRFFAKLMRCHTKVINATGGALPGATASPQAVASGAPAPAAPLEAALASQPPPLTATAQPGNAPIATEERAPQLASAPASAGEPPASEPDDTEPAEAPPSFLAVTVQNPFGEGEIEIEEISLSDIPGAGTGFDGASLSRDEKTGDEYSDMATRLKEGGWIEFRDDNDNRRQARLSYISPLKGTYLFVNRQGKKVGEYSLYQLARELRSGRAVVLDAVPLFDRAMGSLVGALRKNTAQR